MKKKGIKWSNLYLDNSDKKSLLRCLNSKSISGFSNSVKISKHKENEAG